VGIGAHNFGYSEKKYVGKVGEEDVKRNSK